MLRLPNYTTFYLKNQKNVYNNNMQDKIFKILIIVLITVFVSFSSYFMFSYTNITQNQISVTGIGTQSISNQVAEFTVTFWTENSNKQRSESINNEKVKKFLDSIRQFGIEDRFIKTSDLSSYQKQEWNSEEQKNVYKDWVYSQSISVKVVDVQKVNEFVSLTGKSETSNVYGPNYSIDNTNLDESVVLQRAFENAKSKAENLASQSGRKLGKVILISEASNYTPPIMFRANSLMGRGGGEAKADLPSGSSEVSKSINVIFELK